MNPRERDALFKAGAPNPSDSKRSLKKQTASCATSYSCIAHTRDSAPPPMPPRKRFAPPATVYTITVFPTSESWVWPVPHIDHAREEDAHRTFPPPFSIGCLIYLSDIQSQSGGTIVWPGSHRRLQELAAANPDRYKYLASLNRDIPQLDLGGPKEITARAGGALFYHYLCAHSGSTNSGTEPRFAMNHKW